MPVPLPFPWLPGDFKPDSFEDRVQQNFDKLATSVPDPTGTNGNWQDVTFENLWANFGGTSVQYMKDALGFVHMRGLAASGTVGANICTLPSGFRPSAEQRFASISNNGSGFVLGAARVLTTGAVVCLFGGNASFSLDGVIFYADGG